ncbi:putative ParB-like nuclease domain-containing protein, partial [Erwinia tracheiphila PSU-1]
KDAGMTDAACDAAKMKKGDAAEHAQRVLADTRWVPVWMRSGPSAEADIHDPSESDAA